MTEEAEEKAPAWPQGGKGLQQPQTGMVEEWESNTWRGNRGGGQKEMEIENKRGRWGEGAREEFDKAR